MNKELKNTDPVFRTGEAFGNILAEQFSNVRTKTVTISSIDEENDVALVYVYEEDELFPVPLSLFGLDSDYIKVRPTLDTIALIGFMNGDDDRPFFIRYSQFDTVSVKRGATEIHLNLDPDNEENDSLEAVINDTSLKITSNTIEAKTEESTLTLSPDLINFNGGGLSGLVKLNELTDKLNQFVSEFNAHTHLIPSGTFLIAAQAGVPNTGAEATNDPQLSGSAATDFNASDYENDKIVQG